ncbi:MAG: ATP-binding protein [Syntrophomonadaceae bacterium]|nr:ATP-binding protein [Syntrophomonadaceae bacterium]MDD3024043.1 ATP-binding protein [Syntrophomonadaceae bacterium]
MSKRLIKQIFRKVRDANLKYHLVEDGDKVAAALSGGKDSFTMLYFLQMLQKYTPLKFEILPIYIDLGWQNDINAMDDFCKSLGMSLIIEPTNIGQVVFDCRHEKNPCSLCSNLRRGAINRLSKNLNCNKAALGHHMDDAVNTLFLSMIYEGRFNVFKPKTYLDRMDITFIRPLIYVEETQIRQFVATLEIKPVKNRCPADGKTKRTEISKLLEQIEITFPGARKKFLSSIENIGPDSFWR